MRLNPPEANRKGNCSHLLVLPISSFFTDRYGHTVISTVSVNTSDRSLQVQALFSLLPYGSINTFTQEFSSIHLTLRKGGNPVDYTSL